MRGMPGFTYEDWHIFFERKKDKVACIVAGQYFFPILNGADRRSPPEVFLWIGRENAAICDG